MWLMRYERGGVRRRRVIVHRRRVILVFSVIRGKNWWWGLVCWIVSHKSVSPGWFEIFVFPCR